MSLDDIINKKFVSFEDLESSVKKYAKENLTHLYKRNVITLTRASKRLKVAREACPDLFVYSIKYCCVYGGRTHIKSKVSKGIRNKTTRKKGCNFYLIFTLSRDKKSLRLSRAQKTHNHEITEELYKRYFSERILPKEMQKEVGELLNMQVNKKMLQAKLKRVTGKEILLKDLTNLAQKFKHLRDTHSKHTKVSQTASEQTEIKAAVSSVEVVNRLGESADRYIEAEDVITTEDSSLPILNFDNQEFFIADVNNSSIATIGENTETIQSFEKFHTPKKIEVDRCTLYNFITNADKKEIKKSGNAGTQPSSKPELEISSEKVTEKSNQCLETTSSTSILPNLIKVPNNSLYLAKSTFPNQLVIMNPVNIDQSFFNSNQNVLTTRQNILLSLSRGKQNVVSTRPETGDSDSDTLSAFSDGEEVMESDASAKRNTFTTKNSNPSGSTFMSVNSLIPIASPSRDFTPASLSRNVVLTPLMTDTTVTNPKPSKSATKNIHTQTRFVTPSSVPIAEISMLKSIDSNDGNVMNNYNETLNGNLVGSLISNNVEASTQWESLPPIKFPEVIKVDSAIQTEENVSNLTATKSKLQNKSTAPPTDDSAVILKLGGYQLEIQTECNRLKFEITKESKEIAELGEDETLANMEDESVSESSKTNGTEIMKEMKDNLCGNKSANIYTMTKTSVLRRLYEEVGELRFENKELYRELENYRAHDKFYQSLKKKIYEEEF